MLNLISSDVVANGTRLHYYRSGGAKPPVLLVHGISDDGLCWTPVAGALADEFDVVMVDMRGHGKSEAPEDGYTMENLADELAGLITALGLEKPIVLGHSMGAASTLVMAGLFPDLARAILLEDPPPFWSGRGPTPRDPEASNPLREWIISNKRKTGADLLAELRANSPGWSEAEQQPWINSKHRYSPRIADLVQPVGQGSVEPPNLLRRITCPALFISADVELGAISGAADIALLKEYIPQLRVEHIPGAGHSIRRDQFSRYIEVVRQACVE